MAREQEKPRPFSQRHGIVPESPKITIWEDAPEDFRSRLLYAALGRCGIDPNELYKLQCGVLKRPAEDDCGLGSGWGDDGKSRKRCEALMQQAEWHHVYDMAEAFAQHLQQHDKVHAGAFCEEVNSALREFGIGWKLVDGLVEARSEDYDEQMRAQADQALERANMPETRKEFREAILALSRRPTPNISSAMNHAMWALEAVARTTSGMESATLGAMCKPKAGLFPKPLGDGLEKLWGYASNNARHGNENRELSRAEAQLTVGLSAALCTYLIEKHESESP